MVGVDVCFAQSFFAFLYVGLNVEVVKQHKEQGAVGQNHVAEDFGEFTLEEERETGVNEDYHELCELQPGQVSEIEILLHDVVMQYMVVLEYVQVQSIPLTSYDCMIVSKKIALIFLYGYMIFIT